MSSPKFLPVFFLVLLLQAIDAHAQSNPYLEEGADLRALFAETLNNAEFVFEGRCVNALKYQRPSDGEWVIESVWEVDVNFKGKATEGTTILGYFECNRYNDYVKSILPGTDEQMSPKDIHPRKIGEPNSSLIFGNSINGSDFQLRLLGDSINLVIEPIYSSLFSGSYNTTDTKAPLIKNAFSQSNILIFENRIELYQFLIEKLNSVQSDTLKLKLDDKRGGVNQGDKNKFEEGKASAVTISSFSDNIPAGVNQVLDIYGTGFGSFPGANLFDIENEYFNKDGVIKLDNYDLAALEI
jgi:hypothetical protein